jgi:hypothetical protein
MEKNKDHRREYNKHQMRRLRAGNPSLGRIAYRKWLEKNPESTRSAIYRRNRLATVYGLTTSSYEKLLEEQGHKCGICKNDMPEGMRYVDHDHATGEIRGILCRLCNLGLGHLRDDPNILEAAVQYLRKNRGKLAESD